MTAAIATSHAAVSDSRTYTIVCRRGNCSKYCRPKLYVG
jgi:hypothetical protein